MDVKIFSNNVDLSALEQIDRLKDIDVFKGSKIRIMPDVHSGVGCVIGFTGDLGDKVIPNIVGVDIGCGMLTINLGKGDINLEKLDNIIRENIPSGFNVHVHKKAAFDLKELRCHKILKQIRRIELSLGTLGGGNHFIEIDVDDEGNKYLIIHTGSRNLGLQVAQYYQKLAVKQCSIMEKKKKELNAIIKKFTQENRGEEIKSAIENLNEKYASMSQELPNDLCYLTGQEREDYLHDMKVCQTFAKLNREEIAKIILQKYYALDRNFNLNNWKHFETVHNYISFKDNIVRKGAISAYEGEIVLIPINMRDGCIIAKGRGNPDWNYSAPHGAGRIMSRNEARRNIDFSEFEKSMRGIYSSTVTRSTVDEAPMAYKPIHEIIENTKETVEILKIIKSVYNFKST